MKKDKGPCAKFNGYQDLFKWRSAKKGVSVCQILRKKELAGLRPDAGNVFTFANPLIVSRYHRYEREKGRENPERGET